MLKVTYVNYELGYDSGMQTLVGQGGQHYGGPSAWSAQHSCQKIETTFKDQRAFEEAQKNIALTLSLYGRRWVVISIETVPEPAPAPVPQPFVPPTDQEAQFVPPKVETPPIQNVNDRMSAAKLREFAAANDIDITDIVTRAEMVAAIQIELEKRELSKQSSELVPA